MILHRSSLLLMMAPKGGIGPTTTSCLTRAYPAICSASVPARSGGRECRRRDRKPIRRWSAAGGCRLRPRRHDSRRTRREVSVMTLLGDRSDVGVVVDSSVSLRHTFDDFEGRHSRAKRRTARLRGSPATGAAGAPPPPAAECPTSWRQRCAAARRSPNFVGGQRSPIPEAEADQSRRRRSMMIFHCFVSLP